MRTSSYAAVLLYYKKGPSVLDTVRTLLNQTPSPAELVFVDNASRDGVAELIREEFPQVTVIVSETNLGYAGGMNLGRSRCRVNAAFILFATHEVELAPNCVNILLTAMINDSAVVQAGPVLGLLDRTMVWSAGGKFNRRGGTAHKVSPPMEEITDAYWLDGALHLVRANAFDNAGGFDKDFFLYWEDVDLSLRLRQAGKIIVLGGARAFQDTSMEPPYYGARNRVLFWRKHKQPFKVAISTIEIVARVLVDLVRPKRDARWSQASSRMRGLLGGLTFPLNQKV